MATVPPILVWQPEGGVPVGPVSNPPVYSQAGTTQLLNGQAYIDVVFGSAQTTDEWVLVECVVVNEIDATPLNIWPGIITDKAASGFRLQLNGMPDSSNYYLHWAVSGVNIAPTPATTFILSGPTSGFVGTPVIFTVHLPASTTVPGAVTVILSDGGGGGAFSPTTVTLTTGTPSTTVSYIPASPGTKTISATNDGGLLNPDSIALSVTLVVTGYSFSGPTAGEISVASTNFTVTLTPAGGAITGTVTVTPHDGGGGGTFTPTTVGLTSVSPSATLTYTPVSTGAKTVSVTNDRGLPDPANITYTVSAPAPHLLNTLISYWKLDEATGTTRNDSKGTNHLADTGSVAGAAGKINNGAVYDGANRYLSVASNSTLQVTSDFTFSLWVRLDEVTLTRAILTKETSGSTATIEYLIEHYGGFSLGFGFGVGGASAAVGSNATVSTWYHLVCWYDSSDQKLRMRINDTTTYVSTATATLIQQTNPFVIGSDNPLGAVFDGTIDEVGFWKRKLDAIEITALYNSGAGLPFSSFTA